MKRSAGAVGGGGGGGGKGDGGKRPPVTRLCMKALCTDGLTKALIGPRGSTKDEFQRETGTKFVFSNQSDYFPGTHYRVLGIYADDIGPIIHAFGKVLEKLVELGHAERESRAPNPEFIGKEHGEFLLRLCISKCTSGVLIGPGGARIKDLRRDTNTKVFIENETVSGHQMVRIIGEPARIHQAVDRVGEALLGESGTEDHHMWASWVNFSEAPADFVGAPARRDNGGRNDRGGRNDAWDDRGQEHGKGGDHRRARHNEPKQEAWGQQEAAWGGAAGGLPDAGDAGDGLGLLADAIASMPAGTSGLAYSISFNFPACRIDLVRADEEFMAHVDQVTGVQVNFEEEAELSDDPWVERPVAVVGPLLNIYAAHLLMMKRIKDEEAVERAAAEPEEPPEDPEEIKAKIEALQAQLRKAQGL